MVEVMPRPEERFGGRLHRAPGLNMGAIRAMFAHHSLFPSMCRIQPIKGAPDYLEPTAHQLQVGEAYEKYNWNLVGKYRHAFISTYGGLLMARDAMYLSGRRMVILANKDSVAEDILKRIVYAYKRLPPELRMPLDPSRTGTARALHFAHGGWIQVLSAKADDPGEGLSPDLFHISEWGITPYDRQMAVAGSLFPIAQGKPDARVLVESTFGRRGDLYHQQWTDGWAGGDSDYDFNPVFLEWWKDPTRHRLPVPAGLEGSLTDQERQMLDTCDGMTLEHIQFRRVAARKGGMATFDWKYPAGPFSGWRGTDDPAIPPAIVEDWNRTAVTFPTSSTLPVWVQEPPVPGHEYVIFADPASFGRKGDYSGCIVMDASVRHDVAEWEGRAEPQEFAERLDEASTYYNDATIVLERNAGAVLGALGDDPRVWVDEHDVPGWFASDGSIRNAVGDLINLHANSAMRIRSKRTVAQLGGWDGTKRGRRTKDDDGNTQHYELARCAVMAADHFEAHHYDPAAPVDSREVDDAEAARRAGIRKDRAAALFGVHSRPAHRSRFSPPRYR